MTKSSKFEFNKYIWYSRLSSTGLATSMLNYLLILRTLFPRIAPRCEKIDLNERIIHHNELSYTKQEEDIWGKNKQIEAAFL